MAYSIGENVIHDTLQEFREMEDIIIASVPVGGKKNHGKKKTEKNVLEKIKCDGLTTEE